MKLLHDSEVLWSVVTDLLLHIARLGSVTTLVGQSTKNSRLKEDIVFHIVYTIYVPLCFY